MMMKNNYEKKSERNRHGEEERGGENGWSKYNEEKGKKTEKRSELSQSREMNHISISLSLSSLMALIFKCYIIKNR